MEILYHFEFNDPNKKVKKKGTKPCDRCIVPENPTRETQLDNRINGKGPATKMKQMTKKNNETARPTSYVDLEELHNFVSDDFIGRRGGGGGGKGKEKPC